MAFLIYLFHGTEAATRIVLWKKVLLEISQNLQENTRARVSFLIKLQEACNFIKKETLARVFSCEFCQIFKNIFSLRTLPLATSVNQAFIKNIWENQVLKLFLWALEAKHHY